MKLKYYIRTLGLGIFVTALLMGLATTPKTKENADSDESTEVLSSNKVLSEAVFTTEESKENQENTEEAYGKKTEEESEPERERKDESESESENRSESESENVSENGPEYQAESRPGRESMPQESVENTAGETIESDMKDQEETIPRDTESFAELEIRRGDSSDKVSRRLQEIGLIEDAKSFDRYLCDNGIDKRISVGNYLIPTDSSEEEIAQIISGKKK